jgi:diaminohydroxyphosphoribosylaminopyrimidine deaminase/5-amino-6-(5-phosphoribosylamino)uracil reductase
MVGAVIVRGGRVLGEGYHRKAGMPHAEVEALSVAGDVRGATLYVTLEPCSHHGRTPPCTDAIMAAGITRVVCAIRDPNPKVSGIEVLKGAGIEVTVGVLEAEALRLNEAFFTAMELRRPFFVLKSAVSIDGCTVSAGGDSKWITSEQSRRHARSLRARMDAIMVGVGTVLADNPSLRASGGPDPLRVILDSKLRSPLDADVFADGNVLLATTSLADPARLQEFQERGIEVVVCGMDRVDLPALCGELLRRSVLSVLVEGGRTVHGSLRDAGLVDKAMVYIAPIILGGRLAKQMVGGRGAQSVSDGVRMSAPEIERIGDDLLLTYYPATRP